jgi:hypothetical protein
LTTIYIVNFIYLQVIKTTDTIIQVESSIHYDTKDII